MFSFLVAAIVSINGYWTLPTKDIPTDLLVVQHNSKIVAVLRLGSKTGVPVSLPLYGKISSNKCGTLVALYSKHIRISKECSLRAAIIGCGSLRNDTFNAKSIVMAGTYCKGKTTKFSIDNISGPWVKRTKIIGI